jgi:hypothetical protein
MAKPLTIKFPPKTTGNFKERTLGVAYVTGLAGGYVLPNGVAALIEQDLGKLGYPTERQLVTTSMRWLARNGYALEVINGRRTQEFILAPDVVVPTPQFVLAARARAAARTESVPQPGGRGVVEHIVGPELERVSSTNGAAPAVHQTPPVPARRPRPRLPSQGTQVGFAKQLAVLGDCLLGWHATEPDAAEQWVDDVLTDLRPAPSA